MDQNKRKEKYKKFVVESSEREEFKISTLSKNVSCNYMEELLFLTKNVQDWQIYFNDNQINLVKLFVNYKNISDIAKMLNKPYGSIYSALFGSNINDEQGIYSKLKQVYVNVNKNIITGSIGDSLIRRSEEIEKIKIDNLNKDYKKQLFFYIENTPDWREYLNAHQIQIVELYLEYKSCSKVDEIIGKNSTWGILYGKTKLNPKGVYKKLEKAYREVDNIEQ